MLSRMLIVASATVLLFQAGDGPSVDAKTANALAAQASLASGGDAKKTVEAFTALVKARIGEFYPFPAEIHSTGDISIMALPPLALFTTEMSERLRKFEPLDKIEMLPGVAVVVIPRTIRAPKIIKVVLHRDGRIVQPLATSLNATVLQNAFGAKFDSSSGAVVFPMSAFRPGAAVTVTAVPDVGNNIVIAVESHLLKHLH